MRLLERLEERTTNLWDGLVEKAVSRSGGAGPYFLAWLLGVPATLLVIIYLIKRH